MKIRCIIGLHRWEHYSMKSPVDIKGKEWMTITRHFRYCDVCHKNQARTGMPINSENYWYDSKITNKEIKRKSNVKDVNKGDKGIQGPNWIKDIIQIDASQYNIRNLKKMLKLYINHLIKDNVENKKINKSKSQYKIPKPYNK